jgi:ATP-dependent Clp protease ATP-binding subunit ClpA
MFERFTDRARRVVMLAQEAAKVNNHDLIKVIHLLKGMVDEQEGVAAKVLARLNVTSELLSEILKPITPTGSLVWGHIPFDVNLRKVLELALREALQLGHNYIGTEHLLLGVCRYMEQSDDQDIRDVFTKAGVSEVSLRHYVMEAISGSSQTSNPVKPAPVAERAPEGMKKFTVYRTNDVTGVSGTGVVLEGVLFSTGLVVVHWLTPPPRGSITIFDSLDQFLAIHIRSHPENGSVVTWEDGMVEEF